MPNFGSVTNHSGFQLDFLDIFLIKQISYELEIFFFHYEFIS